jgi:hypothetical protein
MYRSGFGGVWLFVGTTPEEIALALKNELEMEDDEAEYRDSLTLEPFTTTQAEIDSMPEFPGW